MSGSERRRAVPFLASGVVGVAGAPDNGDHYSALTAAICKLVVATDVRFAIKYTVGI